MNLCNQWFQWFRHYLINSILILNPKISLHDLTHSQVDEATSFPRQIVLSRQSGEAGQYLDSRAGVSCGPKPGLGKVVLACVYRPPLTDRTSIQSFLTSLEHSLRLVSSERCPVLIAGDFNFKHSQWCASDRTDYGGESLQYVLDAYGYHQLVDFPTRVHQNSLKSCLDLVLTSRWPCVPTITSSAPIGHSDHVTLLGKIQLPSKNTSQSSHSAAVSNTRYVPVWSVEHTDRLNSAIQHENWTDILQSGDINQAWVCWKAKILSLVNGNSASEARQKRTSFSAMDHACPSTRNQGETQTLQTIFKEQNTGQLGKI